MQSADTDEKVLYTGYSQLPACVFMMANDIFGSLRHPMSHGEINFQPKI